MVRGFRRGNNVNNTNLSPLYVNANNAMVIVHDWSGFYYDGTVYTDAEEEDMIRRQFGIPKGQ